MPCGQSDQNSYTVISDICLTTDHISCVTEASSKKQPREAKLIHSNQECSSAQGKSVSAMTSFCIAILLEFF